MKTVFMCALAKLRRKKLPNILLGICILITTALLVNALLLRNELDTIFDRAYENMAGPQMCCLWDRGTVPPDTVRQYLNGRREIAAFEITENTKTIDYIEKDGIKLSNGILLELPETPDYDMLSPRILRGETSELPGRNEIWVTTKIAGILNLKEGGHIILRLADRTAEVRVAKIVADPVFGGSSTNIYRMWCGPGQISGFPPAENSAISCLELRFKEYSPRTERNFIRDTEEYFNIPLADTIYTYDRIKGGYTAPYQMVGAALCFVSVVLSGTMIALTLFLIASDMEEDIRTIGIYKSLGLTGGQIVAGYLGCYGAVGLMGVSFGGVLGGAAGKGLITRVLGDIGLYAVSFAGTGRYQLMAGGLVLAAVAAVCLCAVFRVRNLNASRAIRTGCRSVRERNPKPPGNVSFYKRVPFVLYYAVRGIQNRKLRYGFPAVVALVFGCLAIIGLGCLNAVRNIDREPEIWGFIKTDIYVTSQEDTPVSGIIAELEADPKIMYTYGANKITAQYKPGNSADWKSVVTEVYELPWNDKIKDRSLYGRRPVREYEIGIGLALSREYGLEVGDQVELMVNGETGQYTVTGIFQTLSNYGKIIRMVTDDLDRFVKASGAYGDYMLVLAGNVDKWEYAEELAARYEGKYSFIASKSNGENITGLLTPAVGTILTALLTVTLLITINLTFLLVRHEQRLIGLLKAAGMTSWQIMTVYSLRNGLSALAGNSLGLMLGVFAVPKLLTPYARLLGLSEFPFVNSLTGTAAAFFLLPVCMILSTCAIVNTIDRVSVRQLVSE